jgi:hypothetical protein
MGEAVIRGSRKQRRDHGTGTTGEVGGSADKMTGRQSDKMLGRQKRQHDWYTKIDKLTDRQNGQNDLWRSGVEANQKNRLIK